MTENQNPQEITDDVEGHGLRGNLDADDTSEVEGHATRGKGLHADDEDGDDTEGHGVRPRI